LPAALLLCLVFAAAPPVAASAQSATEAPAAPAPSEAEPPAALAQSEIQSKARPVTCSVDM
jgi:hypothetical protein